MKRVSEYKGYIIVKAGDVYQAFKSNKKYSTLELIKGAIDNGTISNGCYPDDTLVCDSQVEKV